MKTTPVTSVQMISRRLFPCEYVARCALAESRYFQTTQPRPTCAAVKAMPTTMIVIVNWPSTRGPCSEIACGNHQCLLTNIPTEASVISQITIPRARPIGYLLLNGQRAKGQVRNCSELIRLPLCSLPSPIQDHHPKQQRQVKHRRQQELSRMLI